MDEVVRSVEAYSAQADAYEAAYDSKYADIVARFASSLPTPSLILDAGCGPGRDLARFAEHGHIARGLDLNPEFVAKASAHAPTTLCDLRQAADRYPSGMFDAIWAAASLMHLSEAETVNVLSQFASASPPREALRVVEVEWCYRLARRTRRARNHRQVIVTAFEGDTDPEISGRRQPPR